MEQGQPQNGTLELKLNEERTLALATIYPAKNGGEPVTVTETRDRLKTMGVTYGIRDHSIRDAIHYAEDTHMIAANVVVAQGAVPKDGKDARVQYQLPAELLSTPLPKHPDGFAIPDWFALDPLKIVAAGQELASIVPAQPGIPGRTLTWPIKAVAAKSGKPANVRAGANVQMLEATRLVAACDGYACLAGDTLVVYALRVVEEDVYGEHTYSSGLVVRANAVQARIRTESFVAIEGAAVASRIRADEDIIIAYAENCEIATAGSLYVLKGLKNCRVTARKKLIVREGARIVGGAILACGGVDADDVGCDAFTVTEIQTGKDHFSELRNHEIQEELSACETNIKRISKALQPFATHTSHVTLSDEKRVMLHKLQLQKRNLDVRISQLHTERRSLTFMRNGNAPSTISIAGTVWPGVCIHIGGAVTQIENAMSGVRFQQAANGKSIEIYSLLESAA